MKGEKRMEEEQTPNHSTTTWSENGIKRIMLRLLEWGDEDVKEKSQHITMLLKTKMTETPNVKETGIK